MEVSFFRLGTKEYLVDVTPRIPTVNVSQINRYSKTPFDFGPDVYRIMYVNIVNGKISYRFGHPANFVFQIPEEYQDKLEYQRTDASGNVIHKIFVKETVDETELTIPIRIVFKDSLNQGSANSRNAGKLDSIYDLIGEAAGTKTVYWSRGDTYFAVRYNSAVPSGYYDENGDPGGATYVTLTRLSENQPIPSMNINHLAPKVPGMDFAGWEVTSYDEEESLTGLVIQDFSDLAGREMILGSIYLRPLYTPRDDTKYTVRHLIPSLTDPDDYEVYMEETFVGTTHDYVDARDYYRYDFQGLSVDFSRMAISSMETFEHQGEEYVAISFMHRIRNDGRTVIDLYYKRETCRVTVYANNPVYPYYGSVSSAVTSVVRFGEAVADPGYADTQIPGYTFLGWSTTPDGSSGIMESLPDSLDFTIQQDSKGFAYYAIWKPETVPCIIGYYIQDPYGEYQFVGEELQQIECGTPLEGDALKPEGFTIPRDAIGSRVEVSADVPYTLAYLTYDPEGYVIHVYYDLSYYKVVFGKEEQYCLRGDEVTFPAGPDKEGYKFVGWEYWSLDDTNIYETGDTFKVTTTPNYFYPVYTEADDVRYTVKHYLEQVDGTYSEEPNETEEFFDGTTGSFVSPEVKSYTGFESPTQKSELVEADGSTVVEYYYARKNYDIRVDFAIEGENLRLRGSYTSSYKYGVPFALSDPYDNPMYINREGYELLGWYWADDPNQTLLDEYYWVEGDALTCDKELVFKPLWKKGEYGYTVEHYVEQLDGSYVLHRTENLKGEFESQVTGQALTFGGFTYDASNSGNVLSGTVTVDGSLVLKLYYTRNSYDAKWYDYDGTTLLATTRFKFGQTVTAPEVSATREGYTFSGWNAGNTTMPIGGVSFNAKDHGTWTVNTYTVIFDANGGDGTMADQVLTYDRTQSLSANSFEREGYTFAGWSLTADGEVKYADQAQVTNLASSGTVTLYAQWEAGDATAYKIVYYGENLDGTGYEEIKTENHTGVTNTTISATVINIPGFTYDAANTGNVLSGEIAADGSLVLKLYYSRNSYTLTLDFNGESMKQAVQFAYELTGFDIEEQTFTVKYGENLAEKLTEITVYGMTQKGYWDAEIGAVEATYGYASVDEVIFPGYTFGGWGVAETDTMPAEDLTLTAQWTPIEVTVTFYADYGTTLGTPLTKTYSYGDVISLSTDPSDYAFVNDGHFISGWSYGSAASDGAVITGDLVLVDDYYSGYYGTYYSVSGGGSDDDSMAPGEVHIYAFWSLETDRSTITFDGNGATNVSQYTQDVNGSRYYYTALLKNVFIREGYRFTGWNTAADGSGDQYADMEMSGTAWEKNTTLYAQWELIEEP